MKLVKFLLTLLLLGSPAFGQIWPTPPAVTPTPQTGGPIAADVVMFEGTFEDTLEVLHFYEGEFTPETIEPTWVGVFPSKGGGLGNLTRALYQLNLYDIGAEPGDTILQCLVGLVTEEVGVGFSDGEVYKTTVPWEPVPGPTWWTAAGDIVKLYGFYEDPGIIEDAGFEMTPPLPFGATDPGWPTSTIGDSTVIYRSPYTNLRTWETSGGDWTVTDGITGIVCDTVDEWLILDVLPWCKDAVEGGGNGVVQFIFKRASEDVTAGVCGYSGTDHADESRHPVFGLSLLRGSGFGQVETCSSAPCASPRKLTGATVGRKTISINNEEGASVSVYCRISSEFAAPPVVIDSTTTSENIVFDDWCEEVWYEVTATCDPCNVTATLRIDKGACL